MLESWNLVLKGKMGRWVQWWRQISSKVDILTAINGFPLFCQNALIYIKIGIYSENRPLSPVVTLDFFKNVYLTAINGFPLFCQNAPIYVKIGIYSENGSLSPVVTSDFFKNGYFNGH